MTAEFRPQGPGVALQETGELWKKLDTVYYVLPFDNILHLDTGVLNACRWVDPGYMLLAVRNVYRNPHGSIHYFDRYVTALGDDGNRMDQPHPDFRRFQIRYPLRYHGLRPHEILDIWEGDETIKGLPGAFVPFGWAQYTDVAFFKKKMEAIYHEVMEDGGRTISPEKLQKKIWESKAEAKRISMGALKAEVDYRFDHDESYMRRQAEKLDVDDFKMMKHVQQRSREMKLRKMFH